MKKLIYTLSLTLVANVVSHAQSSSTVEHEGLVTGTYKLGNKEIAVIEDQTSLIVYKSDPVETGKFLTGERVDLICDNDLKRAEVIKPNLNKKVFCHNKSWSAGKDDLIYIPGTREIYLSDDVQVIELGGDERGIIVDDDAIVLPESAKSIVSIWGNGNGGSTEITVPGEYVRTIHSNVDGEQVKIHVCKGSVGDCAKGWASAQ